MNSTSQRRSSAIAASFLIAPGSISVSPSQKLSVWANSRQTTSDWRRVSGTFGNGTAGGGTADTSSTSSVSGGDAPMSAAPMAAGSSSGNSRTAVRTNGVCRSASTPSRSNAMRMSHLNRSMQRYGQQHDEENGVPRHLQTELYKGLRCDAAEPGHGPDSHPGGERVILTRHQPSPNAAHDQPRHVKRGHGHQQTALDGELQVIVVRLDVHRRSAGSLIDEHRPAKRTEARAEHRKVSDDPNRVAPSGKPAFDLGRRVPEARDERVRAAPGQRRHHEDGQIADRHHAPAAGGHRPPDGPAKHGECDDQADPPRPRTGQHHRQAHR